MGVPKGRAKGNAGKGRPKGKPNKLSANLKEMILGALADAGGQEYLRRQAEQNPAAFMTLVGKVLPLQVHANAGGTLLLEQLATAAMALREQRGAMRLPAPAIIDAEPVKPAEPTKF